MKIKTKYNIGDEVCTMFRNQVTYFIIGRIDIRTDGKGTSIIYTSKDTYEEYSDIIGENKTYNWVRSEDKIFSTKEELLKSL